MTYQHTVFGKRKRRRRWAFWVVFPLLLAIMLGVGYVALDNGRVAVKTLTVTIPGLPSALEGFTILHISDLAGHRFGAAQSAIGKVLSGKTYHLVAMTGDMLGKRGDPYPVYELITALATSRPIVFIEGDSDPSPLRAGGSNAMSVYADYIIGLQTRGVQYIDSLTAITHNNQTIWLSPAYELGLDTENALEAYAGEYARMQAEQASEGQLMQLAYYYEAAQRSNALRKQMKAGQLHIMLAHHPIQSDYLDLLHDLSASEQTAFMRSINLVLAGHYAGGQWRVPGYGALRYDEPTARDGGWFPLQARVLGIMRVGTLTQHVSGGLWINEHDVLPPFRLFNTPEVTLIKLSGSF